MHIKWIVLACSSNFFICFYRDADSNPEEVSDAAVKILQCTGVQWNSAFLFDDCLDSSSTSSLIRVIATEDPIAIAVAVLSVPILKRAVQLVILQVYISCNFISLQDLLLRLHIPKLYDCSMKY